MANRNFSSNKLYQFESYPVLLSCNFIVDSANGNGLGLRSLKGPGIQAVYMNSASAPAGSPYLGSARSYTILAATSVSNTGSSVLTGNLALTPGSAVTGFPPGTISGVENIDNSAALLVKSQAQAAYTDLATRTPGTTESVLDGLTLTPGTYTSASSMSLAASGNATLTLNGNGVYIFQIGSTLTTGAGGTPTIALTGGALASNVYWQVGSSATLNVSGTGVFQGNILANTSITVDGGSVNGSLLALNGAVTLSAAANLSVQPLVPSFIAPGNPNPEPGIIVVQLQDNYSKYLSGFSGMVAPVSGSPISSGMVVGNPYVIVSLGSSTLAQFQAAGLQVGIVPAIGASFIAQATSIAGGALVEAPLASGSGIDHIEVIGDPNTMNGLSSPTSQAVSGMELILACYKNGVLTAPTDQSTIGLSFYLSNSSVQVKGQ